MADVLFIGETYLKENSVINDNADFKVIQPTIIYCQDYYIQRILGTDLFDEIKTQITNNTVSANNQTLLNSYIMKILFNYILCECAPEFKYRYMNKGVMVKSSENSQSATLEEIQWLMDKWRNRAEWYAETLSNYLCYNASTYPKFDQNSEYYKQRHLKSNYTTSLFLPNDDEDCRRNFLFK